MNIIRRGYTRPLAHGKPCGYGLGWVYPGLCSTPRLRLHACKLPKGMVSVDLFWRETYLHVNMEYLNNERSFGLISVIVTALLLNRSFLRRQRRRRLQSRFSSPHNSPIYISDVDLPLLKQISISVLNSASRILFDIITVETGNAHMIKVNYNLRYKLKREQYSHHCAKASCVVYTVHHSNWLPFVRQSCDWLSRFGVLLTIRLNLELSWAIPLFFFAYPWKFPGGNFTLGRSVTHKKMLPQGKKSLTQGKNG